MEYGSAYSSWCMQMSRSIPSLGRLLFALPALDLPARKAVLSACRVQSYPHDGSRLLARLEDAWGCTIHLDPRHQPPSERRLSHLVGSLRSIVVQLEDYLSSPVFSGFLSSAIRSSPVDNPQTFQQALETGIHKEIEASIFGYRPTHLDYSCIMSPHSSDRSNPLAPNLDSCPDVAQGIYEALCRTRATFDNFILFPRCGSKTVGKVVEQEFWRSCPDSIKGEVFEEYEMSGGVTTAMLQKLEYWKGIRVSGPVEMRTSWKYSQLKPRVYFAQGGDTFHTSKYVQTFFNKLVDSLDIVHTKNRYGSTLINSSNNQVLPSFRGFDSRGVRDHI